MVNLTTLPTGLIEEVPPTSQTQTSPLFFLLWTNVNLGQHTIKKTTNQAGLAALTQYDLPD